MAGGPDNIGENQGGPEDKDLEQSRIDNLANLGLAEQGDGFPDLGVMEPEQIDDFVNNVEGGIDQREGDAMEALRDAMENNEKEVESPNENLENRSENEKKSSSDIEGWKKSDEADQAFVKSVREKGVSVDNLSDYIVDHLDIDEGPLKTLANEVTDILGADLTPEDRKGHSPEALLIARQVNQVVHQFNLNEAEIKAFAQQNING